jgi:hypothetical protein
MYWLSEEGGIEVALVKPVQCEPVRRRLKDGEAKPSLRHSGERLWISGDRSVVMGRVHQRAIAGLEGEVAEVTDRQTRLKQGGIWWTVAVLPSVPVTPMVMSWRAGKPR